MYIIYTTSVVYILQSVRDKQAKFDFTSDSSSPPVHPLSPVVITIPPPESARSSSITNISAVGVLPSDRPPLSPIESAAERSSDLSGLHSSYYDRRSDYVNHQRDSYYNALYEDTNYLSTYDDGCYSAVSCLLFVILLISLLII